MLDVVWPAKTATLKSTYIIHNMTLHWQRWLKHYNVSLETKWGKTDEIISLISTKYTTNAYI